MQDNDRKAKQRAILKILAETDKPVGSTGLARELNLMGVRLRQRMIRYYLDELDALGFTENLGRRGRRVTSRGLQELESSQVYEKVGLTAARIDELVYKMDFDPARDQGSVVVNVSRFRAIDLPEAAEWIRRVLEKKLGMGRYLALGREGDVLGGQRLDYGEIAIGTLCSITVNGAFRLAGIPMHSRFGGLVELRGGSPVRFTQIIHYEGTTIDPVQVFLKSRMTTLRDATLNGNGVVGAGFREIPAAALPAAEALIRRLEKSGFGCVLALGRPGTSLLEIPVSPGRVGIVLAAGLNAVAAVEEAGISTTNTAMACLYPREHLIRVEDLAAVSPTSPQLHARLRSMAAADTDGREHGIFE